MAKGFKFPAPKGFAKGGMCSPKGAKAYAKGGYAKGGGPIKGTNVEASDLYSDSNLKSVEAGRNVPMANKNRMRSESVQNAKAKADLKKNYDDMYSFNPKRMMDSDVGGAYTRMRATEDQTGEYKKGGKVKRMAEGGKMRSERTEQAKADRYALDKIEDSLKASPANKKYADYRRDEAMEDAARTGRQTGYGIGQGLTAMKNGGKVKKYANGGPAVGPGAQAAAPAPMPQLGRGVPSLPDRPTAPQQLGRGVPSLPDRPTAPQQLGRGLPSLPDRPTAPLSAAAQGRSTGLPMARPVPGPVTGTALSPAQSRRSTGLPEPDLSKVGSGVGTIMPQRPASGAGNTLAGTGRFANGGKVTMKKMKGARKFLKTGYADGGEVETEQMASKSTRVKMPRGGKTQMSRAKSVPVNNQQPMIQPRGPSMMGASPLARVANTAPSMGMKMGGKAKKH